MDGGEDARSRIARLASELDALAQPDDLPGMILSGNAVRRSEYLEAANLKRSEIVDAYREYTAHLEGLVAGALEIQSELAELVRMQSEMMPGGPARRAGKAVSGARRAGKAAGRSKAGSGRAGKAAAGQAGKAGSGRAGKAAAGRSKAGAVSGARRAGKATGRPKAGAGSSRAGKAAAGRSKAVAGRAAAKRRRGS